MTVTQNFDYISFALSHTDHEQFTTFFINKNKAVYENYVRISTEQGMLESFKANPLAIIVMNEPRCCYKIAVEYIEYIERCEKYKRGQTKFDELLEVIAQDCIDLNRVRTDALERADAFEFTAEQNEKYRTLAPPGEFWGGYAYLDDDKSGTGFIRLYSPQGSGKWSFWMEGEKLVVDCA